MDAIQLPKSCNVDQIIDDLDQQGFSIIDDIYTQDYVNALVKECSAHLNSFREAAIQNGVIQTIRNDQILWIDPKLPIAQQHIATLKRISERLNQYFYLGLKEVEAHFACYNSGNFYALHRDNPQQKKMIESSRRSIIYMSVGKRTGAANCAYKTKINSGIFFCHSLIAWCYLKVIYYMKCSKPSNSAYRLPHGYDAIVFYFNAYAMTAKDYLL